MVHGGRDIQTTDALDEWTDWGDGGDADWWLQHSLQRPPRQSIASRSYHARRHELPPAYWNTEAI